MRPEDIDRLGLYILFWSDEPGDLSLAAVGQDSAGRLWFAPTNWLTVPSYDWSQVRRVLRIASQNEEKVRDRDDRR